MRVATEGLAGLSHAVMNPPPTASETPISPGVAKAALTIERYVLPWMYAYFAWQWVDLGLAHFADYRRHVAEPMAQSIAVALTRDLLRFLLTAFSGGMLLFSRTPRTPPDRLKHITVPLVMSFYFPLYALVERLPAELRESLIPPDWQPVAAIMGLLVSLLGYVIAIWALLHLGRSFAMLVSVRTVVSGGPYAYVRHPIYLGYVLELCGLLLASCSPGMLLFGVGFAGILVCRARIEEEVLCAADEGYRQRVARTGFLLPRFSGRR